MEIDPHLTTPIPIGNDPSAIWLVPATRQVLDSMADMFIAMDRSLDVVFANRALREVVRERHGDIVGRNHWDLWPEAHGTAVDEAYSRALATGVPAHFEYRYPGTDIWVDVDAFPSGDYLHVYFRDVSAKRRAEEELQAMVDSLPQIAWASDAQHSPVYLNRRWYEYTGNSPDEPYDGGLSVHPDDLPGVRERMMAAEGAGGPMVAEARLRRFDGEYRWHLIREEPRRTEGGAVVGYFGSSTDVHDMKEAERALAEREAALRSFFDCSPLLMGVVELPEDDADVVHLYDSAETERLLGQGHGLTAGRSALSMGAPDEVVAEWVAQYRRSQREGRSVRFEYVHPTPEGERWLATNVCHIGTSPEGRDRFSYVTEDVTEQRAAQEASRRNAETFESLVRNSPFGVYVVDADFRLTVVSQGAQKVFQNARPLLGRDFAQVLRTIWEEPFASEAIAVFRRVLDTGEPFHSPSTVERREDVDEIESYDWKVERIVMPDGRLGAVCHFYDLSERLGYEAALRESEALAKSVVDTVVEGVLVLAPDGEILLSNAAFGRLHYGEDEAPYGRLQAFEPAFELFDRDGRPVPPEEWPAARALRGERVERRDLRVHRTDTDREFWGSYSAAPVFDEEGNVRLAVLSVADVTERMRADRELRDAKARTEGILASADVATWVLDVQNDRVYADRNLARMFGADEAMADGGPSGAYVARMHPDDRERVAAALGRAMTEGAPYDVEYRIVVGGQERWVTARGIPERDDTGTVVRLPGVVVDVTALKRAQVVIEGQLRTTRTIAENADSPLMLLSREGFTNYANPAFYRVTGYSPEDTRGKTAHELIHYRYPDGRPFPIHECPIDNAYWNLQPARNLELTFVRKDGSLFPVVAHVAPLTGEGGGMQGGVLEFRDVTEERELERALRESADQYRQIAEGLPQMVWSAGADGSRDYFNARWLEYTGVGLQESENPWLAALHPEDRERALGRWREAIASGEPFQAEYRLRSRDGRYRWFLGRAIPLRNDSGEVARWFGTCTDVHDQRATQEALEIANEFSRTIAQDLDLSRIVQALTDASTEAVGAQFGSFFYNVVDEQGESYMLFTLSGAPREAFDFGMPRATEVFGPTFRNEGIVRSDDITKDPRYGRMGPPHHGMPKGHLPVVSYLAVPVVSRSGEVIGGLFFGHSQPAMFTEEHEAIVSAFAAQAAVAMDNARLYDRVSGMNQELERKVEERTAELLSAVERLQGFTYHVSHDLRAPLRAIASTSHVVREDYGELLPEEAHALLGRQAEAATRLGQLVDDLLKSSRLSRQEMVRHPVDLTHLARDAAAEALGTHPYSSVDVVVEEGLAAHGDPKLLRLALLNLIENAVKYSPSGGTVRIGRREDGAFFVSDEGIGIDPRYFGKIFEPFQRLHLDSEFAGTGIGLSNVRQVVERHGGTVWVESEPGRGSTFLFTLG